MKYTLVKVECENQESVLDILTALLAECGFEMFEEEGLTLKAYVQTELYSESELKEIDLLHDKTWVKKYEVLDLPEENWNKQWESAFEPVIVNDQCAIRATFHTELESKPYDIIIDPKMSFGTGHHQTTWLMSNALFNYDCKGKSVLDMGCGTGVLGILAEKLGASSVHGIDIDEWAYNNAVENIELNKSTMTVELGDASLLQDQQYDLILANINRNIILKDLTRYLKVLKSGGRILFSGFLEADLPILEQTFAENKLKPVQTYLKEHWACLDYSYDLET